MKNGAMRRNHRIKMADTYLGKYKKCGTETDLIYGVYLECNLKEVRDER